MKKENDAITKLFRSRLENVKMPVRDSLWESLEKDIPATIQRRHRNMIYRIAAAASILIGLMGSSAAFLYFSPKEEIADAFTQVAVNTAPPKANISQDAVKVELPAINDTHVKPGATPAIKKTAVYKATEQQEKENISMSFSMSISITSKGNTGNAQGQTEQVSYAGSMNSETTEPEDKEPETTQTGRQNKNKKWALGISASTALKDNNDGMNHKMPLSLGLTIRKELSGRVALESGITYTQLNSDFDVNGIKSHQKLHYIGIPLKADISLHKTDKVNLYVLGGGMIEKCVSGGSDAYQASLLAGVGLDYKLNKHLSLYAEPGISYHFDDGSSMNTLRSEKPLNMNLLCGVRMTY